MGSLPGGPHRRNRGRPTDPAVAERKAARRARRAAILASAGAHRILAVVLAVLMVALVGVGCAGQFGLWWGMIVTGALCGLFALLVGWE